MVRFFVGIDVSKRCHAVAVIDDAGALKVKPFSIPNSAEGLAELIARLIALATPGEILIGMEATSSLGWPFYYRLSARGFQVHVLNPLQSAAFAKTNLRRTKTDPIDAVGIAQLLRFGKYSPAIIPDERALRLRELTRYRSALCTLLVRFKNMLAGRVYRTFPEFAHQFPEVWSTTALGILDRHPLPHDVASASQRELADEIRLLSRGRLVNGQAEDLQRAAHGTIGLPWAGDVYALQIRGIVAVLRLLQDHATQIMQKIEDVLAEAPEFLTTIPGVGEITAATVLGEIVDIRLFDRPEKLVAFAGYDPSTFQTGQYLGSEMHISKRGSTHLRRALWLAAFSATRHNPDLRAYYERKRDQGKHHRVALGAVCRKLLHLIWRILTDNRAYENRSP